MNCSTRSLAASLTAFLILTAPRLFAAPPAYTFTDLGALAGESFVHTHALNNAGQVAGSTSVRVLGDIQPHVAIAVWDKAGGLKDLAPLPPGTTVEVCGIDGQGDVVGWVQPEGGSETGFIIPHGKAGQSIVGPGGGMTYLFGINEKRQAVGYGSLDDGIPAQAFRWHDGSFTGCGRLGEQDSSPAGIGPNGEIVGKSRAQDGMEHPFLWDDNHGMRDLGLPPGAIGGEAMAVNASGTVVGSCQMQVQGTVPFIWTAASGMRPLSLDPKGKGQPTAINSAGIVVGSDGGHAVMWVAGIETNLSQFAPRGSNFKLLSAAAINDKGQIVGDGGVNPTMTGSWHGWLLTPVGLP